MLWPYVVEKRGMANEECNVQEKKKLQQEKSHDPAVLYSVSLSSISSSVVLDATRNIHLTYTI